MSCLGAAACVSHVCGGGLQRLGFHKPTSFSDVAKGTAMNKLIKGSIAGAAGIALLLGGAGTLALWNDTANLSAAGSIKSGVLDVTAATPGTWNNSIALIVPGDTRTFTQTVDLTATGDNLKFTVSNNVASLLTSSGFSTVTVTPTVVVKNGSTVLLPVAGKYTAAQGATTVTVSILVTFPSDTDLQVDQNKTADLSTATVTVNQVS